MYTAPDAAESEAIPADGHETHATPGGAVAAGAVTGAVIGIGAGPAGIALGAIGGAIVAVLTERCIHGEAVADEDPEPERVLVGAGAPSEHVHLLD